MVKAEMDLTGIFAALDQEVVDTQDDMRAAAQAGAQVYYDEARLLVPERKSARTYKGKTYKPGALKAALYQVFSQDRSSKGRAVYHISWNARKAPHGHLIEFGHWTKRVGKYGPLRARFVPAQSFIRKAYEMKKAAAVEAVLQTLADRRKARRGA